MMRVARSIALVGAIAIAVFCYAVFVDRRFPIATTPLVITPGDSLGVVAQRLAGAGVIGQPVFFRVLAKVRGEATALHAGSYRFPAHQSAADVLARIVVGDVDARWVTIPEGFTGQQIADRLAGLGLVDATAFERYLQTHGYALEGRQTPNLEGYLFPSTYLVPVGADARQIANLFTDEFARVLPANAAEAARRLGITIPQGITIASLIEREAKVDAERPLMAGVYYNRLRLGMPLQVDASIEYVLPNHHAEITRRDLALDSPYNTYRHTGLPPTPIANPGKASIDAAFAPTASKYLYYVYAGNGRHVFATTLAEHEANVNRYLH
jgi:UPF0755 protein